MRLHNQVRNLCLAPNPAQSLILPCSQIFGCGEEGGGLDDARAVPAHRGEGLSPGEKVMNAASQPREQPLIGTQHRAKSDFVFHRALQGGMSCCTVRQAAGKAAREAS